ncbi:hypothetical protein [Rubrivivax gelatinosus]|uniref:Lipoprotein n=1 Tax=Rubrivivax gelatinosus (strain NBRC 100245 / IL144) TaxID=983917 RepID=I0HLV5_RUBGI|nr:hypothetical protein [Rubrivivax gelatinosus]MBG6080614.1 hypothetical protein [Rubrivivax gelatinosus]BAL93992.1 hypothetical protein RGE_06470 [Rubrivivax gelatinosus IL144]
MLSKKILPWLGAAAVAGCASTGEPPYAEITVDRVQRADPQEEAVTFVLLDGERVLLNKDTLTTPPGVHILLVESKRRGGPANRKPMSLYLNTLPCRRYVVAARHESMTAVLPWQPEVKRIETIPECQTAPSPGAPPAAPAASAAGG